MSPATRQLAGEACATMQAALAALKDSTDASCPLPTRQQVAAAVQCVRMEVAKVGPPDPVGWADKTGWLVGWSATWLVGWSAGRLVGSRRLEPLQAAQQLVVFVISRKRRMQACQGWRWQLQAPEKGDPCCSIHSQFITATLNACHCGCLGRCIFVLARRHVASKAYQGSRA